MTWPNLYGNTSYRAMITLPRGHHSCSKTNSVKTQAKQEQVIQHDWTVMHIPHSNISYLLLLILGLNPNCFDHQSPSQLATSQLCSELTSDSLYLASI